MRHQKYLLHALTTNNMASLRQEQRYVSDTLSVDSLSASPYMRDYLCAWVNSTVSTNTRQRIRQHQEPVKRGYGANFRRCETSCCAPA